LPWPPGASSSRPPAARAEPVNVIFDSLIEGYNEAAGSIQRPFSH
jgi:hypothetical protein